MFLPTDYQLQLNVIFYDVNSARIYFTDTFWKPYSDQLIKDFRRETGVILDNRRKFLAQIKRALFDYFYVKLVCNKKPAHELYSSITAIFNQHSHNSLPKLVKNIADVPVFYDDEWHVQDPPDTPLDRNVAITRPRSVGSMTDILLAHESVSKREFDINKEHEDLADTFLDQFFNEKDNFDRIDEDYRQGRLQEYFLDLSTNNSLTFNSVLKFCDKIFQHYDGKVGMVTILNMVSYKDMDNPYRTDFDVQRRFDLWMKTYNQFSVFRSLVNYIGLDTCEQIYTSFIKDLKFTYYNGYHYVFCSFILHDFLKRSLFKKNPLFTPKTVIELSKEYKDVTSSNIFGSISNKKTQSREQVKIGFGLSRKETQVFSGKGLTSTDAIVTDNNRIANPFQNPSRSSSIFSSSVQFSNIAADDSD
jgi:hypothetical protein